MTNRIGWPPAHKARSGRAISLLIGAVVSALLVWRTLAGVAGNLPEVGHALRAASPTCVGLGLLLFLLAWALRAVRWRLLLADGSPPTGRLFSFLMISNLGNAVLPMRMGDILRAFLVGKASSVTAASALASLFVEKLWDLMVITGYLVLAVALLGGRHLPVWVLVVMGTGGAGFLAVLLFVIGCVAAGPALARASRPILRLIPRGIAGRVSDIAGRFRHGIIVAGRKSRLIGSLLLSLVVWGLEVGSYVMWSRAVGVELPPVAAMLVMTIANLSFLMPAAPGGIGTYDYACSTAIALFAPAPNALAAAVLIHATMYLTVVSLGAVGIVVEGVKLGTNPLAGVKLATQSVHPSWALSPDRKRDTR